MGIEIERKFLVDKPMWELIQGTYKNVSIRQGYLSVDPNRTVRVHVSDKSNLVLEVTKRKRKDSAKISVKGITRGATRPEFEYPIPVEDTKELFELCVGQIITKRRFFVMEDGSNVENWKESRYYEVDVFTGHLSGLIVAEIELKSEDEEFFKPGWLGKEVTDDLRYYNANMAVSSGPPPNQEEHEWSDGK